MNAVPSIATDMVWTGEEEEEEEAEEGGVALLFSRKFTYRVRASLKYAWNTRLPRNRGYIEEIRDV